MQLQKFTKPEFALKSKADPYKAVLDTYKSLAQKPLAAEPKEEVVVQSL